MEILKSFKIFNTQLKNNWVRQLIYRTNFVTSVIVDFIWLVIEASFFTVIYGHTETLAGWSQDQVYYFLGVFFASDALFTLFFGTGFWTFPDLVNKGELDIVLTKPAPVLLLTLTRSMSLTAVFNFIFGLLIIFHYGSILGLNSLSHWLITFFWLITGLLSQVLLRFFFCVWIFWTDRGFSLSMLYYKLFSLATKPDAMYPYYIRYIILTALPFAFIGSVPARALISGLSTKEFLSVFFILSILFFINATLWKKGLKRYQSASS